MPQQDVNLPDDPLWYKDAIIYELHIKAFYDSDNDGIGDIKGLTEKLDYLRDLGVTAIWLLPFYPSPLRDDGYDIADYFDVHPQYGTLADFKELLREAHRRGLRVITELVLNHTSDQHPWFQRARRAKAGSPMRDFYVWSETADQYKDARIIFQDFEHSNWTWDHIAKAYFWHRFYSHQPDLNYDNPQVQKAMFKVIDYWMKMGVDGVRLDAVPYLYEREGTNCENLPETYEYLKKLRAHVDANFRNRMLLAEANQWPEDAVAYFGSGDECNMAFHFPLMPRMFMALQMEDNFPILDILDQTPPIPDTCQWALFLRNHDELTLEMVTDEERDYMYRIFARDPRARINLGIRRRLAPLLGDDLRQMKLLKVLLFTLPGTPVLYYGDEIGMGDNYYLGDRDGVRTPMQWSADSNAGFSRANPQRLYLPVIVDPLYHYQTINVQAQEGNPSSMLWWMRGLIALRKQHRAFSRGSFEVLYSDNRKIFSFIREYGDERIIVAVNLSRHFQVAKLDISKYAGFMPEELMSKNRVIPITKDAPYVLTFGPYEWYMFLLQKETGEACEGILGDGYEIEVSHDWSRVLEGMAREELEQIALPSYLGGCTWFGGKVRRVQEMKITESIPVGKGSSPHQLLITEVDYTEGPAEIYTLPLSFAAGDESERVIKTYPNAVVSKLKVDGKEGILYDALYDESFCTELLNFLARKRRISTSAGGALVTLHGHGLSAILKDRNEPLKPQMHAAQYSNTAVRFGEDLFLKIYRHPDVGINPDLEISMFLSRKGFPSVPAFLGGLELRRNGSQPVSIGILQRYVKNQGNGADYFLAALGMYCENLLTRRLELAGFPVDTDPLTVLAQKDTPPTLRELLPDGFFELVDTLAIRTAQLHRTLASESDDPQFAPENYSILWQRSVFQSMQSLVKKNFMLLKQKIPTLPQEMQGQAEALLSLGPKIIAQERVMTKKRFAAKKIRFHGDFNLDKVLYTGKDFVIFDFEGEPARPLGERRLKKSPLRDVASMIRSFHYTAYLSLFKKALIRDEDRAFLEPWMDYWYRYTAAAFLRYYLLELGDSDLIPKDRTDVNTMIYTFLLDKAVYELAYELEHRPDLVEIPMRGIRQLIEEKYPV